jgi:hypothetical protein
MAKSRPPRGPGGSSGSSGATLRDLTTAAKQQVDLLNRLLAVARFGPSAGGSGGGLPGRAGAGTPEDRAAKIWEDRARLLYNQAQAYNQVGAGALGGGIANVTTAAQGAKSLGLPGAGLLGRLAGPLGVLSGGLSFAAHAAPTLHDSFLTNTQKARQLADLIPGVAEAKKLYDDLSGRKQAFEKANVQHEVRLEQQRGELQRQRFEVGFNPNQAGLEARAAGLRGASPVLEGRIDRSTAAGQKEFEDRQRLLPIEREIAKAGRETSAATAQRVAAAKELAKLDNQALDVTTRRAKLDRDLARESSGVARKNVLHRRDELEQKAVEIQSQRQQAAQQLAEARRQEAASEAAVSMGRAKKMLSDAADLEQEAATSRGTARSFGAMDAFGRYEAVQNVELLKRFGPDMLDPSQVQQALAVAPRLSGKILENRGLASAEFGQLQRLSPEDAVDVRGFERQAQELRDEAAKIELSAEKAVAQASAEAGKRLGDTVVNAMNEVVANAERRIMDRIRSAKTN